MSGQELPSFAVKPAGSNSEVMKDWYDLDAIFQDDFFPQDLDFANMLNDDKSMTSFTQQLYDARQPGSAIANIDHKNIQQDLPSRRAEGAKRKAQIQQEEDEYDDEMDLSDGNRVERRDRNREHAKRSRIRKRVLLDTLQDQLTELRAQNLKLRRVVADRLPADLAAQVLLRCTTEESTLLVASPSPSHSFAPASSSAQGGEGGAAAHRPSALTAKISNTQGWAKDTTASSSSGSSSGGKTPKMLMESDYRLIHSLITSQQNFVLSDPSLPDNPIVYASDGFCRLSGYKRQDVLGRNCRFLQGPGTDQAAVNVIRQGVREGRDVSVCLLNYRADGSPFWNQFFLGALKDANGAVVNYVGVQCEVNTLPIAGMKDRVKKLPLPGV